MKVSILLVKTQLSYKDKASNMYLLHQENNQMNFCCFYTILDFFWYYLTAKTTKQHVELDLLSLQEHFLYCWIRSYFEVCLLSTLEFEFSFDTFCLSFKDRSKYIQTHFHQRTGSQNVLIRHRNRRKILWDSKFNNQTTIKTCTEDKRSSSFSKQHEKHDGCHI